MRITLAVITAILLGIASIGAYQAGTAPAKAVDPDQALLNGCRKSAVASVADAVDQIVKDRGFMSHDMRPRVPGQIVGRAVTAVLRAAPPERTTAALSAKHSVAMIDSAKPGEV